MYYLKGKTKAVPVVKLKTGVQYNYLLYSDWIYTDQEKGKINF